LEAVPPPDANTAPSNQDATQGLLAPQDAKARGGMEASLIAAHKTKLRERRQLEI